MAEVGLWKKGYILRNGGEGKRTILEEDAGARLGTHADPGHLPIGDLLMRDAHQHHVKSVSGVHHAADSLFPCVSF